MASESPPPLNDIEPHDPAAVPPPLPQPATAINFCRECGVAWQVNWVECPNCRWIGEQHRGAVAAARAADAYRHDMRWLKGSMLLYFALLAVSFVTLMVAVLSDDPLGVRVDFITAVAFSTITLGWVMVSKREMVPVLTRGAGPTWYVAGAILAGATFIVAHFAVKLLTDVVGLEEIRYTDDLVAEGYGWWVAVVLVCLQPAVVEELAFRGVIQTSLMRVLGAYESVFVSALMFGILHLSLPSMPHLFLIGVVLGWLRVKTGSLYPGMLMHFIHNLLVLGFEYQNPALPL